MKLKLFYFSKGGYTEYNHTIEWKDKVFHNSTFPEWEDGGTYVDFSRPKFYPSGYEDPLFSAITFIDPSSGTLEVDPLKLEAFLKYSKRYCEHWKKEYINLDVLDGTHWEVDIWTDKFRLKSIGSNDYPGNFESFIWKLTQLTEGKMF